MLTNAVHTGMDLCQKKTNVTFVLSINIWMTIIGQV